MLVTSLGIPIETLGASDITSQEALDSAVRKAQYIINSEENNFKEIDVYYEQLNDLKSSDNCTNYDEKSKLIKEITSKIKILEDILAHRVQALAFEILKKEKKQVSSSSLSA